MKRGLAVLPCVLAAALFAAPAQAINVQVPYSGQLAENGQLVQGTRSMRFQIVGTGCPAAGCYDTGAAGINVTISNGAFSVLLGGTGLPALDSSVFATTGRQLRISVAGTPLTPDVDLPFAPYAAGGDHATLQNRNVGDPHAQYFERDGSDPLAGNLTVLGNATLGDATTDTTTVSGALTANSASISGALTAGSATFSGALSSGAATLASATISGALTANGTVILGNEAGDAVTINGTPVIAGSLDVNGGITAGTPQVTIVGTDGKIPNISATTFASLSGASLTSLNGSNITSGTISEARLDDSWTTKGFTATTLATTNTTGTSLVVAGGITAGNPQVAIVGTDGRIPSISATTFANLSGASLTSLNGSSITSGTVNEARLDDSWTTKGFTATTLATTSTTATSLDVAGGINAGTGNVAIVGADGKIPSISGTTFANLSGAALTGVNADLLDGITSASFLRSDVNASWGNASAAGTLTLGDATGGEDTVDVVGKVTVTDEVNFGAGDIGAPSDGSAGWKLRLYDASAGLDFGLGINSFELWIVSGGKISFRPGSGYVEKVTISSDGNLGIGTATPGTSSLLELSSTSKALVLPRMTKTQRDAINPKVAGMMIYQTDNTAGLRVYNGTNWVRFTETVD